MQLRSASCAPPVLLIQRIEPNLDSYAKNHVSINCWCWDFALQLVGYFEDVVCLTAAFKKMQ
jgi:hypothetical protein